MKKIIISLVALSALAGAASATQNRSYDLRDLQTLNGYSSDGAFLAPFSPDVILKKKSMKPVAPMFDHTNEHQNSTI